MAKNCADISKIASLDYCENIVPKAHLKVIEVPFIMVSPVRPRNGELDGGPDFHGGGAFLGFEVNSYEVFQCIVGRTSISLLMLMDLVMLLHANRPYCAACRV